MIDVIVIGGGLNGLVAAAELARKKFSVLLIERLPQVGGGAALSHALGPISADVLRSLDLHRQGLTFLTPDPALTTLGTDGRSITFHRDHVLTSASIERHSPHDAGRWQPFATSLQRMAALIGEINRQAPPTLESPGASELWNLLQLGQKARSLGRRDLSRLARYLPMAVADLTTEWFEHDLVQGAIAARAVFGHAVGPWSAGTGAMLLRRMAEDPLPVGSGVTFAGGPAACLAAIAEQARTRGVEIRTGASVSRVVADAHVTGVELESGEFIPAHAVVAAIAPKVVMSSMVDAGLLPPTYRKRVTQIRATGTTAQVTFSLSGLPVFPALQDTVAALSGRLLVAPSIDYLERAHDAAKYGDLSPAPSIEASIPTVADPQSAEGGRHVMSVYVQHAPAGTTADAIAAAVLGVLEAHAPGFGALVTEQRVVTVDELARDWGYPGGHIFHADETLDQWWVSRPLLGWADGYTTPVPGLFLASAGTHPGGGLTGQSGLNAARAVSVALSRRRR